MEVIETGMKAVRISRSDAGPNPRGISFQSIERGVTLVLEPTESTPTDSTV